MQSFLVLARTLDWVTGLAPIQGVLPKETSWEDIATNDSLQKIKVVKEYLKEKKLTIPVVDDE